MPTQTATVSALTDYAASPDVDPTELARRVTALAPRRVDATVVVGGPSGYLCEQCSTRPELCSVSSVDPTTGRTGVAELCYPCAVAAVDRALDETPTEYIGVELRRPLTRS